jgi:hypothetical protein
MADPFLFIIYGCKGKDVPVLVIELHAVRMYRKCRCNSSVLVISGLYGRFVVSFSTWPLYSW